MATKTNDNLEKEIQSLVAEILELSESKIMPDVKFVDELGMDSMMALEILASVEKKYKIRIPEEYLTKIVNLKSLVEITLNIISKT